MRTSVAMTGDTDDGLAAHLLRLDGQEDVCLATYCISTGRRRRTALLRDVVLPGAGDRAVHGNASFTGDYVLRAATQAADAGEGVALLHSHPRGRGWQGMSSPDADAERSYAHLVEAITGLPLLGMTLAGGDRSWSARTWEADGRETWCESVRVNAEQLLVSWNDDQRPVPAAQPSQIRTASAWGERAQADIARLRVLVVGVGSVGLDVALRLAATGIQHVAVMDFDGVEIINLDRLVGATRLDVRLHRSKVEVAKRLMLQAATAGGPEMTEYETSICDPAGHSVALDYDIIFSCVDRPWPRAVLNALAYADLIPVIDGGIAIDAFDDGTGMRNATWRSHVLRPGRPCLGCNKQLDLGAVQPDRQGLLDDAEYIAGAGRAHEPRRQNVAALSASVSASLLAQFVSLVVAPGGQGEPGPLQYSLSTHTLEHLPYGTRSHCAFENAAAAAVGDRRPPLTDNHAAAANKIEARRSARSSLRQRVMRISLSLFRQLR